MEAVDCIVIGAGVIGLACARALAQAGREVLVLEAAGAIGTETSSRNSEVIHAGIYYPRGSLKARLCRAGRDALYRFADEFGIPHLQVGKLIVGSGEAQLMTLQGLAAAAHENGVDNLRWLDQSAIATLEPDVRADHALFSPSTGIIDSHAFMISLQGQLEACGGSVVLQAPVTGGKVRDDGIVVQVGGIHNIALLSRLVVNAAGLNAAKVSRTIAGLTASAIPSDRFAIGHYYRLSGRSPCSHLVYPVPEAGGLGVHLTLELGGPARVGADVRWIVPVADPVDERCREAFIAAIHKYLPDIAPSRIHADYTGVRPKLSGPGEATADFRIEGPDTHGTPRYVALYGIESPGLTSSLAIAAQVVALAQAAASAR